MTSLNKKPTQYNTQDFSIVLFTMFTVIMASMVIMVIKAF